MDILFLKQNYANSGVHFDLIQELIAKGHKVTLVTGNGHIEESIKLFECSLEVLHIKTKNIFSSNIIKKGFALLKLEHLFKKAINKHLKNHKFDLVLYATPPITFNSVIKYCKKKYNCKSYLMLKDIFPQNAVDIGMMRKYGVTGILYKYFRKQEKKLYAVSDKIGCMSQANIDYILEHNKKINKEKLEFFPNSIIINPLEEKSRREILQKLNIADNKLVFIYGGNLGKPQGLNFLVDGIKNCIDITDIHFVIIGKGSEQKKTFNNLKGYNNTTLLEYLPADEYSKLCKECDVGIVMLDKRFTIPNYPSRVLSYMENAIPIFACTDKATDIKELVEDQAKCGKWIFSDNPEDFKAGCLWFLENRHTLKEVGKNGRLYLEENFDVAKHIYKIERIINDKKETI